MADKFIKHILMLESLKKSDYESPKTARQIQREVEQTWKKLFPNEPADKPLSLQTIHRHVKAVELSGLYKIKRHEDNKRGYYNAGHLLSTADVSVLGVAVYQTASLTGDEKQRILSRLKATTDTDGGSIIYSFEQQIKIENKPTRQQSVRPKIKTICRAIVESKKIKFYLRQDSLIEDWQWIIASPYYIIRKNDELYVTSKVNGVPKDFKITLMSKIEIQNEEFQSEKNFPLGQHLNNGGSLIELKISFPESFIEKVIERFKNNKVSSFASTGKFSDGERQFRIMVFVGENGRLYEWLRQHCNKIKIYSPINVKDNLKAQLSIALGNL